VSNKRGTSPKPPVDDKNKPNDPHSVFTYVPLDKVVPSAVSEKSTVWLPPRTGSGLGVVANAVFCDAIGSEREGFSEGALDCSIAIDGSGDDDEYVMADFDGASDVPNDGSADMEGCTKGPSDGSAVIDECSEGGEDRTPDFKLGGSSERRSDGSTEAEVSAEGIVDVVGDEGLGVFDS
jgi:hypothetical protein